MSKEQLTTPQSQQDVEPVSEGTGGDIEGLPPRLYAQVMALRPGDSEALGQLLIDYDTTFAPKILAIASTCLPMSTVRHAIARPRAIGRAGSLGSQFEAESSDAVGRPGSIPLADLGAGGQVELEGSTAPRRGEAIGRPGSLALTDLAPGGEVALEGTAPGKEAPKQDDAAWVVSARAYNTSHATFADEFNDLTNYACSDGGTLEPEGVAAWQRRHGLEADGKVGPKTVAAARATKAKKPAAPDAAADARIDI